MKTFTWELMYSLISVFFYSILIIENNKSSNLKYREELFRRFIFNLFSIPLHIEKWVKK